MQTRPIDRTPENLLTSWSNRFLIAAIFGILFLTLFPFRLDFQTKFVGTSPFFLDGSLKNTGLYDSFLNVLLFVPFGFGLSEKLREHRRGRIQTFFIVFGTGALLSYAIEFVQAFIPMRDSGWEDVFTNSSGAAVGFILFELLGRTILGFLSRLERVLSSWVTFRRAAIIFPVYFLLWFAVSAKLQSQTRLSNWDSECALSVGNDSSGQNAWKGQISLLQIWDYAVPPDVAARLASKQAPKTASWEMGVLASYNFSGTPPFPDQKGFLPPLLWTPAASSEVGSNGVILDGKAWLTSKAAGAKVAAKLRQTNQFAVHVICTPAETHGARGHIVSISRSSSPADLVVRQEDSNLVLWFRSPLSIRRANLSWYVPNVFADSHARDIFFSYDGAVLSLYIDGEKVDRNYRLSPGAGLARFVRRIRPAELDAYNDIYYFLVFIPAGIFLGIVARKTGNTLTSFIVLNVEILFSAVLFEWILASVSGRFLSFGYMIFSCSLVVCGALWMNSDRGKLPAASLQA
jgi:glycopeptide antibiotics resistance protein